MNGKSLCSPRSSEHLAESFAPPIEARGSHRDNVSLSQSSDRIETEQRSLRCAVKNSACQQQQYSYKNVYNHCPKRLLLCDASDASAAGQFVRLMGVVASVDFPACHGLDEMISVVLDDGTGIIEVIMRSSSFHGKEGIIISLGDGGTYSKRETVFPSNRCKRSFASSDKNQPLAKKSEVQLSMGRSLALGQCVECIGTLGISTLKRVSNLRLVADSVSIIQDPNAMNLRHLEILSQKDVLTSPQLENFGESTGILGIAGNLVSHFGTFSYATNSTEKEKEDTVNIEGWESPQRISKKKSDTPPQGIVISKGHLLRLLKCCSHGAEGISEADLLLILGCMDDGCPEEWAGVLRESLEDLKGEGEIYVTRQGKFLPI